MVDLKQKIDNILKTDFAKVNFEVFLNENESITTDHTIKSQSGKEYQVDVRVLDLSQPRRDKTIKIPKSEWNYDLPDNLYIAYIIVFGEEYKDIFTYLIPSSVFQNPDGQIFFDNPMEERFKHFANWEIRFFKNAIEHLSKYAFDRVVGELT